MRISDNPFEFSDVSIARFYQSVGYGSADAYLVEEDLVQRLFPAGIFGFFATSDQGDLIGMIRIFSDDITTSWIAELCVVSDRSKDNVMKNLVHAALRRFGHTAIFATAFEEHLDILMEAGITAKAKITALSRAPRKASDPEPFMH